MPEVKLTNKKLTIGDRTTIFLGPDTKEQMSQIMDARTKTLSGTEVDGTPIVVYSYPTMGVVMREIIDYYYRNAFLEAQNGQ